MKKSLYFLTFAELSLSESLSPKLVEVRTLALSLWFRSKG